MWLLPTSSSYVNTEAHQLLHCGLKSTILPLVLPTAHWTGPSVSSAVLKVFSKHWKCCGLVGFGTQESVQNINRCTRSAHRQSQVVTFYETDCLQWWRGSIRVQLKSECADKTTWPPEENTTRTVFDTSLLVSAQRTHTCVPFLLAEDLMKTETGWAPPPDQEILCNIDGFDRKAADSSRGPNSQPSHLKQEKSEKWLLGWNGKCASAVRSHFFFSVS